MYAISNNYVGRIGEEDFQMFVLIRYVEIVFVYYFTDNASGTTIWTNLNDTYPNTIQVQYLWIVSSSFGEQDFQRLH